MFVLLVVVGDVGFWRKVLVGGVGVGGRGEGMGDGRWRWYLRKQKKTEQVHNIEFFPPSSKNAPSPHQKKTIIHTPSQLKTPLEKLQPMDLPLYTRGRIVSIAIAPKRIYTFSIFSSSPPLNPYLFAPWIIQIFQKKKKKKSFTPSETSRSRSR